MKRIPHFAVLAIVVAVATGSCVTPERAREESSGERDRLEMENSRLKTDIERMKAELERSRLETARSHAQYERLVVAMDRSMDAEASAPPDITIGAPAERLVPVFYGTDRHPTGRSLPDSPFDSDRRSSSLSPMDYGVCIVSIPPNHQKGDHERPNWWKLEFSEDPESHIVITSVTPMPKDPFFAALAGEVGRSSDRQAFVFIHGYNTSFDEAVRTTGQLAFDLAIPGAAILYSWPSKGGLEDYVADNGEIKWTIPHFRSFLSDIRTRSGASTIHLIAHSLGNSTLKEAVQALTADLPERKPLANLVLAAPDVDAEEFVRDYVPALKTVATRITIYASENDLALKASRKLWQHPRIGQVPTFIDGVDTIDASAVSDDWFGHSYLIESPTVLRDIATMIRTNAAATTRPGLDVVTVGPQSWWKLR